MSNEVRNDLMDAFNTFIKNNNKRHISLEDRTIKQHLIKTTQFLKANPNIFITKADKGNVTVVLNKTEFLQKVELALSDTNYYSEIKKSPLLKLQKNIKDLIEYWRCKGVFDTNKSFASVSRADIEQRNLAIAYILVKIHKVGNHIRIIVSAIDRPTYALDKNLSLLFNRHFSRPITTIKNSIDLKKITDDLVIPEGYELSSIDVISLFSNISNDLILHALEKVDVSKKQNKLIQSGILERGKFVTRFNLFAVQQ